MKKLPFVAIMILFVTASLPAVEKPPRLDEETAGRFAELALKCVHQEYPNKIAHVLLGDGDVLPPRKLTPAFYGCFDWHSAVHGHWLLARLARLFPGAPFAAEARAALDRSLTPEHIAVEAGYLAIKDRASFERPYGLAWLLQLAAELREWDDSRAAAWSRTLAPLEEAAAARLKSWLPKLSFPVRSGEHSQTAFALGLVLDWARTSGDVETARLVEERIRTYYLGDRNGPLSYEPSGEDFLSPCLAEADAVRRVLPAAEFAGWLEGFLPRIPRDGRSGWLAPAVVTDPADGKLVHLDGLNLSRAWMLEGVAPGLLADDPRRPALLSAAAAHAESGLRAVSGEHYEGGHWLASFAVYLTTKRGNKS
ncbi:MAG: hypothetical protein A2Y56_09715 [Candidatus Aminicenantes bacterium RBG_13_63_10]|nr:MAG: hypothetical protein A2Y56_09715 [Candidatus Aminicenantes bacterium RBG_13_63_10]